MILSKLVSGSTGPKGRNGRPQMLVTRTAGEPVISADQEIINYKLSPQGARSSNQQILYTLSGHGNQEKKANKRCAKQDNAMHDFMDRQE